MFLFPTTNLTENTQKILRKSLLLLPICTVATLIKAIFQCCDRVFRPIWILIPNILFNCMIINFTFSIWVLFLLWRYSHCMLWYWRWKRPHPGRRTVTSVSMKWIWFTSKITFQEDNYNVISNSNDICGVVWCVCVDRMAVGGRCRSQHCGTAH